MVDHSTSKSSKDDWMEDFKDWLIEDSMSSLWCNICQKSIKRKRHNVELHASTNKHIRNMRGMSEVLGNMKEDPLDMDHEDSDYLHSVPQSEPDPLDYATLEHMKQEGDYFIETKEDFCHLENLNESSDNEYISVQANEIDEFAMSIAAQMKMLPEDQVISLFYEIQNLITQKRLQDLGNRQKNQEESNIVISAYDINEDV